MSSSAFNAPDENPLSEGGLWTSGPGALLDMQKVGGAAGATSGAGWCGARCEAADAGGVNQYSQVTFINFEGGPAVRMQSATSGSCYFLDASTASAIFRLYKITDTGSINFAQLGANITPNGGVAPVAGAVLRLEARGTTLEVFQDGISLGTRIDATFSGGNAGIFSIAVQGQFSDWSGGSFTPPLRVMCIGDSITQGFLSSNGSGYRGSLFHIWQQLPVLPRPTFVGQHHDGPSTVDGLAFPSGHEGVIGSLIYTAPQIDAIFATTPNVDIALVLMGTNDITGFVDLVNAPARMATLISTIFSHVPAAAVVLSTVLPFGLGSSSYLPSIQTLNAGYKAMVAAQFSAAKVSISDPYPAFAAYPDYSTVLLNPDTVHPTDAGYALLAAAWWSALQRLIGEQANQHIPEISVTVAGSINSASVEVKNNA